MNKKQFVKKFIKDPATICWPKEMKIVKTLFSIFPNHSFWEFLETGFKLNSLCWFLSDDGRKFLNTEYKKFNFQLKTPVTFDIKTKLDFPRNLDYSIKTNNKKTLKNFLNLW